MHDPAASLSSSQSTLEDLAARIEGTARDSTTAGNEELATGLFEIERTLRAAIRRLENLRRNL